MTSCQFCKPKLLSTRFIILSKSKIVSPSDIINIDAFDANASASSQQTIEARVENRAQETVANFLYLTSFSFQGAFQSLQRPPNNVFIGHATINFWGYDLTFGHYPLDPAFAQLFYHESPHIPIGGLMHIISFCYISS